MSLMTHARRLTRKQCDAVLVEYDLDGRLAKLMEELGPYAMRVPDAEVLWPNGRTGYGDPGFSQKPPAAYRTWVIFTVVGPLGVSEARVFTSGPEKISIGGDAVFCVFDEPERARPFVGASLNGKWNHHAFVSYCHSPTSKAQMVDSLDVMFQRFRNDIRRLVPGSL